MHTPLKDTVMELTALEFITATNQGFRGMSISLCSPSAVGRLLPSGGNTTACTWWSLALGLALMLPLAALQWSREEGRRIALLDPFADFVIAQAMLSMCCAALRKGTRDWHCGSR